MNILLFILGACIVYGLQFLFCRLTWNRGLSAGVSFSENTIREGGEVQLTIAVENRKMLPVPTVKVNVTFERGLDFKDLSNLAVSDKNYRSEIFSLRGYERVVRNIPLICARRGYYAVDGVDFIGNDLFYTRRFPARQAVQASICVLPGKADARQLMVATQRMYGETVVRRSDMEDPFTFRGIRQYQNFDSIRDINWKASAKTGDLRVNIHDFTAEREIAIVLDTEWDSLLRLDSLLEESIRIAASLADEFIAKGITTALISNGRDCLTGEYFSVGGSADVRHSEAIQYGLARVKLPDHRENTICGLLREQTERMDAQPDRKVSWVLISTQTGSEIAERFREIAERAVRAYWIIPARSVNDVPEKLRGDPDVMIWEAAYGK